MKRRSSRREEAKIAQGGTLGMRSSDGFRGGARLFIVARFSAPFALPLWADFTSLGSYTGRRFACPGPFSMAPYGSEPMIRSWDDRRRGHLELLVLV